MSEKRRGILLYADGYNFTTNDGEIVNGLKVYYVTDVSLEPVTFDKSTFGVPPFKASLPYEQLANIKCAPAVYDFFFREKVDKNGKCERVLVSVEYLCTYQEFVEMEADAS